MYASFFLLWVHSNSSLSYISGPPEAATSPTTPTHGETVSGWFELCDLTDGQSPFKILPTPLAEFAPPLEPVQSEDRTGQSGNPNDHGQSWFSMRLSHGVQFQTGCLVWSLTALPQDQVLTIKIFRAAQDGRLHDMRNILDSSEAAVCPVPFIFVTPPTSMSPQRRVSQYNFSTLSIVTDEGIDINTEYRPPTSDDSFHHHSTTFSPSPTAAPSPNPSPYLLLHIAVVNRDLDMVLYLLDKGADVS